MDNNMLKVHSLMNRPSVSVKAVAYNSFPMYLRRGENKLSRLIRYFKKAIMCYLLINLFICSSDQHPFKSFLAENAYAAHPVDTVSVQSIHHSNWSAHFNNKRVFREPRGKGFIAALIVFLTLIIEWFLFFALITAAYVGSAAGAILALFLAFIAVIPISIFLLIRLFRGKRNKTIYY